MHVGIDGCKTGWVAIALSEDGAFQEARALPTFAELIAHYADATTLAVDMPVGLVEDGDRDADWAARRFLKGQSSSVFSTPPRPVLAARSYEDAAAIARRIHGKGISQQAFALLPKIAEVDAFTAAPRLHEAHPEISFRLLNAGARLDHKKKSWAGHHARLALLHAAGIRIPPDLPHANPIAPDDILDAAAAAWTAHRIAQGQARRFPEMPTQRDRSGRVIVVCG